MTRPTESRLSRRLAAEIEALAAEGRLKGAGDVISGTIPPTGNRGRRFFLEGEGKKPFLRLDSNSYLGLNCHGAVIAAGEKAARAYGAGPGSVRFIHGTCRAHVELEERLAAFHRRPAAIIFNSAYAAVCGALSRLVDGRTAVLSDELNHNSIINALRLSRPAEKIIYPHLAADKAEEHLALARGRFARALLVSDGVFSMRGDHAPLPALAGAARKHDSGFEEGVFTVVDDSHGTGAFGLTGRGTCEQTGEEGIDLLISTLGKALGSNGGYAAGERAVIDYLRETSPLYIYTNPITAAEAGAAREALEILDSETGRALLARLRENTARLRKSLADSRFETIPGEHPVVPLMVRDRRLNADLVSFLRGRGILAVGLQYPVVPRGDECLRLQVSAEHTATDLDLVVEALIDFRLARKGFPE